MSEFAILSARIGTCVGSLQANLTVKPFRQSLRASRLMFRSPLPILIFIYHAADLEWVVEPDRISKQIR
jgi:hypothetical protein